MEMVGENTLYVMKTASWYNNLIFSYIEKYLGKEILEIGAGIGNFTNLLLKKGNVTTIDINNKYIEKLRTRFKDRISVGSGNIETGKCFFKNKQFDSLVCLNVLEHIKDDMSALSNMRSLLKNGGKLSLLVPAHQVLYSNFDSELGHFRRYSLDEVRAKLTESGFKIKELFYMNWWGAIGWYVFLKLSKGKRMPFAPVSIFDVLGKIFLFPEKIIRPPFGLSVFVVAERI
jgi:ubiquinone/menaquinone biosynthesis C-methylase UbiE